MASIPLKHLGDPLKQSHNSLVMARQQDFTAMRHVEISLTERSLPYQGALPHQTPSYRRIDASLPYASGNTNLSISCPTTVAV
jgi:hypothetical protein